MWNMLERSVHSIVYGGLFQAVRAGDFEQVEHLLELGEEPNLAKKSSNSSYTTLHLSVIYSQLDCAILLLEKGANPNLYAELNRGGTSLHFAVSGRKICFIRLLLFFGAEQTRENQAKQQVTNLHVSNKKVNNFMENICQRVSHVTRSIKAGEECFSNNKYSEAIKYFESAAVIYEQQIEEELKGTYDALYENRNKPDNKPLISYFYKKALNCYQSTEKAYDILNKQGLLETAEQRGNYLNILNKITSICGKIKYPQESYANTIAILTMSGQMDTQRSQEFVNNNNISSNTSSPTVPGVDSSSKKELVSPGFCCLPTTTFFSSGEKEAAGNEETPLLEKKMQ